MSRKPNTDSRRNEIVSAMQRVLALQGYEKATILAIAKEAALAPGIIHYHFKNKQEILVELVKSIASYGDSRFKEIAATTMSPNERLQAFVQARLSLGPGADANIVSAWVMIGTEAIRQAEVRIVYQKVVETELEKITELIKACLSQDQMATINTAQIAAGLMALIAGAFTLSSSAHDVMPGGYAYDSAMNYLKGAIGL